MKAVRENEKGKGKESDRSGEQQKPRKRPGRVPTACAECRRLKLRCDRKVPCGKCVSRGCGSICPDGSLTPGKGNRMILANTEELHDRIEQLCVRNRQLEDALRVLHGTVSNVPHPLLQSSPLPPNFPSQESVSAPTAPSTSTSLPPPRRNVISHLSEPLVSPTPVVGDENFTDAFGKLTLGPSGEYSFFGKTARSEYFIHALAKPPSRGILISSRLSTRIIDASFPDSRPLDHTLVQEIFDHLPPLSEAVHLCDIYLEHGKYMYTPVLRQELFDDVLTVVYRTESFDSLQCHHSLALLLIIFAIAALYDPGRQPYSIEAQEYYCLARTALGLSPPCRQTTMLSVQALIHMAQYLEFSDWESVNFNSSWTFIGQAVRLGHSIGLNLNSARWNLSEDIVQRRSRLFWQLFVLDTWASFCFGRPPIMSASFIDCPFPKDTDEKLHSIWEKQMNYRLWNYQFTVILRSIMTTAFGPMLPAYSVIIGLDRKVRDFPVPISWRQTREAEEVSSWPPETHMQRWMILSSKESTLLHLHREYFAQALHDQPTDLATHKYIPSVIAIFRSAWRLIEGLCITWKNTSQRLSRVGFPWSQALSAAIVMCLLITRAPTSNMTRSALQELDSLLILFQEAAPSCRSAANLLELVQKLGRKAHETMDQSYSHSATLSPAELDHIGGRTHLLADGVSRAGSSSSSLPLSGVAIEYMLSPTIDSMHPTITQDMQNFNLSTSMYDDFFDFPPGLGFPLAQEPLAELRSANPVLQPVANFHKAYQPQIATGTAPLLDPTWQSFVEQLGF